MRLWYSTYISKQRVFFPLFRWTEQFNLEHEWRDIFSTFLFHNSRYRDDFFCSLIPRMEWAMDWQSLFPPHWLWRKSRVSLSLSNTARCFLGWVTLHIQGCYLWQKDSQVCRWWERELSYDNVILTQPCTKQSVTLLALISLLLSETWPPQFSHPAQSISLRLV